MQRNLNIDFIYFSWFYLLCFIYFIILDLSKGTFLAQIQIEVSEVLYALWGLNFVTDFSLIKEETEAVNLFAKTLAIYWVSFADVTVTWPNWWWRTSFQRQNELIHLDDILKKQNFTGNVLAALMTLNTFHKRHRLRFTFPTPHVQGKFSKPWNLSMDHQQNFCLRKSFIKSATKYLLFSSAEHKGSIMSRSLNLSRFRICTTILNHC